MENVGAMKRLAVIAFTLVLGACASHPGNETPSPYALPAPPPAGEPADFVGLTAAKLQASLGKPAFARRENGSELWRYDNANCRSFFFLYPAGREMAVRHVETLPHPANEATDSNCLASLRAKPAS